MRTLNILLIFIHSKSKWICIRASEQAHSVWRMQIILHTKTNWKLEIFRQRLVPLLTSELDRETVMSCSRWSALELPNRTPFRVIANFRTRRSQQRWIVSVLTAYTRPSPNQTRKSHNCTKILYCNHQNWQLKIEDDMIIPINVNANRANLTNRPTTEY